MKESLRQKLLSLTYRYADVGGMLSDGDIIKDQNRFRTLSKEYAELEPVVQCFKRYETNARDLAEAKELIIGSDTELKELALGELKNLEATEESLEQELKTVLVPKDPNDERNIFLEVRAGTGGDEAAIFAGDLFRMYARYAEGKGWKVEIVSQSLGEHGGYKEVISRVMGQDVYSQLKFESGAHRVQRVPATESQGRVHTSACTVAVMPEVEEIDNIDINPVDLRIDTFRSSGAGGQHVNTTDSAIRITHIPTGVVVECQDERSQHKNKARAMSLLSAKLLDAERSRQHQEQSATRKSLVGSGDRSERIRTYNYSQSRVTDHRIGLTLYQLDDVMEGNLDPVIQPLIKELQAELLAEMGER